MKKLIIALILCASTAFANPLIPKNRNAFRSTQAGAKRGFVMWQVPVGVEFYRNHKPQINEVTTNLTATVSAGETASVVMGFYATRNKGCIRIFPDKSKFKITVHLVQFQGRKIGPQKKGVRVGIPFYLPHTQEGELRKGDNTAYWLTIEAPDDISAGEHIVNIKFGMQERDRTFHYDAGDTALARRRYADVYKNIPLTITVLPYKLPQSKRAFGVFYNGGRFPDEYQSEYYEKLYCQDMAEHGQNSAFTGSWKKDLYHTSGFDKTGKIDFKDTAFEVRMGMREKAGMIDADVPILIIGHSGWDHPKEYRDKFYIELERARKERGWPEFILYGPDEPGRKQVAPVGDAMNDSRKVFRTGTAMKKPDIEVAKYFDVWIVNMRSLDVEGVALAKERGAELWTYDYIHRGTNPAYHRFYAGLYTWAHNLRGNFLWAYTHSPTSGWETDRTDHRGMTSPSAGGPVSMPGWEARRSGIDDCRTLSYLETLAAGLDTDRAKVARAWLGALRRKVPYRLCTTDKGGFDFSHSPYWWDMSDLLDPCPELKPWKIRKQAEKFIIELEG